METDWVGRALLLALAGVILGMVTWAFISLAASKTRRVAKMYLLILAESAVIALSIALALFEHLVFHRLAEAELAGMILVVCFIALCIGMVAIFYDKWS